MKKKKRNKTGMPTFFGFFKKSGKSLSEIKDTK